MSLTPDFSTRARRPSAAPGPDRMALWCGAALLALVALLAFSARRELGSARAGEQAARQAAREAQASLQALGKADPLGRLAAARARLAALAPPPRVLRDLERLMPADVRLEQASLSYGEEVEVELRVVARSARAYDGFLERLGASSAFAALGTGPENRDGEVRALVRARYAGHLAAARP